MVFHIFWRGVIVYCQLRRSLQLISTIVQMPPPGTAHGWDDDGAQGDHGYDGPDRARRDARDPDHVDRDLPKH